MNYFLELNNEDITNINVFDELESIVDREFVDY